MAFSLSGRVHFRKYSITLRKCCNGSSIFGSVTIGKCFAEEHLRKCYSICRSVTAFAQVLNVNLRFINPIRAPSAPPNVCDICDRKLWCIFSTAGSELVSRSQTLIFFTCGRKSRVWSTYVELFVLLTQPAG